MKLAWPNGLPTGSSALSSLRAGDAPINVKPLPRGSGVKTADKTFMSQSLSEGMLL